MRARSPFSLTSLARVVAAVLMVLALASRDARAEGTDDARMRADVLLHLAETEDESLAFASALRHYDEGRALDPGSPLAPRAEARAALLRAHSEAEFEPFAELERVRRDPALASDGHAIDELVRKAEEFPAGLVRVEVWVLAAEAYAHRLGRPAEADVLLRRVLADPKADPVAAQKAARDLVMVRLSQKDLAGAQAAVTLAGTRADPRLGRDVRRAVRRRQLHIASIVALLAMMVLAMRAWVTAARRGHGARVRGALAKAWRLAVAYAAYVALGGGLLATGYEAGTMRPFLYFGAVLVPIVLVARAWGAAGGSATGARAGRALACGVAAMGAAVLVLENVDVGFLDGMGL